MQTTLLDMEVQTDALWLRAAMKECIEYGEHGIITEETPDSREVCFNCGGSM